MLISFNLIKIDEKCWEHAQNHGDFFPSKASFCSPLSNYLGLVSHFQLKSILKIADQMPFEQSQVRSIEQEMDSFNSEIFAKVQSYQDQFQFYFNLYRMLKKSQGENVGAEISPSIHHRSNQIPFLNSPYFERRSKR